VSGFDERYYRRYYGSSKTRVASADQVAHLCAGVVGMIRWFGGDLGSVLDVGAGPGLWRDWFREHARGVRYRTIDVSDYACRTFGHEQQDIATFRAPEKYDLIVCQGVLPYLSDADVERATVNLAAMARGFLYLEAITLRDLDTVCDRGRTDTSVRGRSGEFYLSHLTKHFKKLGCGLYYVKDGPLLFYELEACDETSRAANGIK
jgi:hypothetical protein